MRSPHRQFGVTLMELLVAILITGSAIFVVNAILDGAVRATRRGTQAGQFIRRSRALNHQLRFESRVSLSSTSQSSPPHSDGRMVGPMGRDNAPDGEPGGFLVIINHRIDNVPLTVDDNVIGRSRSIRSDQLMFIHDQMAVDGGKKRLPVLCPSTTDSFGGDMDNSYNAEYARIWYGHVQQMRTDGTWLPADDLGASGVDNPNRLAQDWVLGHQALLLTGNSSASVLPLPRGAYTKPNSDDPSGMGPLATVTSSSSLRLRHGLSDVSSQTLANLMDATTQDHNTGQGHLGDPAITSSQYRNRVLNMGFVKHRLLTSAKPMKTNLTAENVGPMHTYFISGVSDFIIEFAHDYFTGYNFGSSPDPDGDLDTVIVNGHKEIRWYSFYPNSDPDYPQIYLPPVTPGPGFVDNYGAGGAFVWQHDGSDGYTSWPWLIRVRYRLHDRRGDFVGRRINGSSTTLGEEEPGHWFETVIPVNRQAPSSL